MDTIDLWFNLQEKKLREMNKKVSEERIKPRCYHCREFEEVGHHKECVNYNPPNQPIRSNRIVAHCPNAYSLDDDQMVGFDTLEELLKIDFVKRMSEIEDFYRYSYSDPHLMAEYNDGKTWWVIGHLRKNVGLPKWESIYE